VIWKLWAIFRREYAERVRSKWFVFATIFGPLVMAATLFLPSYLTRATAGSPVAAGIRVLDATTARIGPLLALELAGGLGGDTSRAQVRVVTPGELAAAESSATAAVRLRALQGYLVLEDDRVGGVKTRYAGRNASSLLDMERLRAVVTRHVLAQRIAAAGVAAEVAAGIARARVPFSADRITEQGRGGSGNVSLLFAITVGLLLYMTILMYGQNVLRGVMDEKQARVAEMVIASVRPGTLLAGKVLGIGAVGLTQVVTWIATSALMLEYRGTVLAMLGAPARPLQLPHVGAGMLVLLVVFFLLGYTLYAALFAAVGAMVSSEQEAQQAQIPVIMMLVLSILFLQPVLNAPDSGLATTLAYLPFSAPVVMPLRMSAVSVPWWEVTLSLVALASASYLAVYVAARIYRTGILLYGKRPGIREVLRWIRRASA
jgi:ABC-2 type transport system permease protein